jgi:hypothetical protein
MNMNSKAWREQTAVYPMRNIRPVAACPCASPQFRGYGKAFAATRVALLLFSLAVLGLSAQATVYSVKISGGGNFTTIQACANAAKAGDTCVVYAGTYNEYVTLPTSGSAGSPITFQVNPGDAVSMQGFNIGTRSYITIGGAAAGTGFEVTNNYSTNSFLLLGNLASHIIIQNNYIHGTSTGGGGGAECIRQGFNTAASFVYILRNRIEWCGQAPLNPSSGLVARGDHWLIDGNSLEFVNNYFVMYVNYSVLRNNRMLPEDCTNWPGSNCPTNSPIDFHIDGFEHSSSCTTPNPTWSYNVIENNLMYGNNSSQGHWGIWHSGGCGDHNSIIRFNTISDYGSFFVLDDGTVGAFAAVKTYNNTIANVKFPSYNAVTFTGSPATVNCSSINNLWYNTVKNGGYVIALDGNTQPTFTARNDLAFNTGCTTNCFSGFITTEPGVVLSKDPLLSTTSSDLALGLKSPAIGAGSYLTTVASSDSGSGTTLAVNDAAYFQDGYGMTGVQGDWIRVGTASVAQILAVDYVNNILTLSASITRSPGSSVYLFKDSSGNTVLFGSAPDIGARPFAQQAPGPASGLNATVQ